MLRVHFSEVMLSEALDLFFFLMDGVGNLPYLSCCNLLIVGLMLKGHLDQAYYLFDIMVSTRLAPLHVG